MTRGIIIPIDPVSMMAIARGITPEQMRASPGVITIISVISRDCSTTP